MDIWGAGCVLYEIVSRVPLFPGSNELDQLHRIHAVMGTPSQKLLKAMLGSKVSSLKYTFPEREGTGIRHLIPQVSQECVDLINLLLTYNPDERINSKEALRHSFFKDVNEQSGSSGTSLSDAKTTSHTHGPSLPQPPQQQPQQPRKKLSDMMALSEDGLAPTNPPSTYIKQAVVAEPDNRTITTENPSSKAQYEEKSNKHVEAQSSHRKRLASSSTQQQAGGDAGERHKDHSRSHSEALPAVIMQQQNATDVGMKPSESDSATLAAVPEATTKGRYDKHGFDNSVSSDAQQPASTQHQQAVKRHPPQQPQQNYLSMDANIADTRSDITSVSNTTSTSSFYSKFKQQLEEKRAAAAVVAAAAQSMNNHDGQRHRRGRKKIGGAGNETSLIDDGGGGRNVESGRRRHNGSNANAHHGIHRGSLQASNTHKLPSLGNQQPKHAEKNNKHHQSNSNHGSLPMLANHPQQQQQQQQHHMGDKNSKANFNNHINAGKKFGAHGNNKDSLTLPALGDKLKVGGGFGSNVPSNVNGNGPTSNTSSILPSLKGGNHNNYTLGQR
ncbi:hypothetical protein HK102_013313 [Quaeritorhiza haematococci]|nr:hypothetical protein HK102_013313 [Quaeritorhiza haematococci]